MQNFQLSIIQRLPKKYCWATKTTQCEQVILPSSDGDLILLHLLNYQGKVAHTILMRCKEHLVNIRIRCEVISLRDQPHLVIGELDESVALCHLKNIGIIVAESILPNKHYL